MKKNCALVFAGFLLILSSCKKGPGEGGNSSIAGYVHVTEYHFNFLTVTGDYDGADEDVYIIYGDELSYGDHLKTGPDGKFEFKYLREGSYKLYVYTDDSASVSGKASIIKTVEINGKNQTVDSGTFEVKKDK